MKLVRGCGPAVSAATFSLLRRQHALATTFLQLGNASGSAGIGREIKIADDLIVIGRHLEVIDLGGELPHLGLRLLGDLHHRLAWRLHLEQQRAGKYRVGINVGVAQAVERRLTLPRREQHEHAFGRVHAGEPARHADRAFAFDCEGIVAASIEDQDHGRRALLLQAIGESIGGEGGVLGEAFLARTHRRHVDREKVVGAVDGKAMSRKIDERRVSRRDLALKLGEGPAHGAATDILSLHHVKADLG